MHWLNCGFVQCRVSVNYPQASVCQAVDLFSISPESGPTLHRRKCLQHRSKMIPRCQCRRGPSSPLLSRLLAHRIWRPRHCRSCRRTYMRSPARVQEKMPGTPGAEFTPAWSQAHNLCPSPSVACKRSPASSRRPDNCQPQTTCRGQRQNILLLCPSTESRGATIYS